MKKFTDAAIAKMTDTIQEDLVSGKMDGGDVWGYIEANTNIIEQMKKTGNNPIAIALSGFIAGLKWSLECIRIEDEDLVDDNE